MSRIGACRKVSAESTRGKSAKSTRRKIAQLERTDNDQSGETVVEFDRDGVLDRVRGPVDQILAHSNVRIEVVGEIEDVVDGLELPESAGSEDKFYQLTGVERSEEGCLSSAIVSYSRKNKGK